MWGVVGECGGRERVWGGCGRVWGVSNSRRGSARGVGNQEVVGGVWKSCVVWGSRMELLRAVGGLSELSGACQSHWEFVRAIGSLSE